MIVSYIYNINFVIQEDKSNFYSTQVKVRVCPDDDLPQASPTANELLFGELDPRFRAHRERSRRKQEGSQKGECINGQRTICNTKYKTECTTIELTHEVEEEYPNCKVEMVDDCKEKPDKFGNCKRVGLNIML